MKNLLISKSFSYKIAIFSLLRQSNTYHLRGIYSIQLSNNSFPPFATKELP